MKRKNWVLQYSRIFLLAGLLIYILHIVYGKSFIYADINQAGDGLVQHYTALMYYGEWLRTVLGNIFVEHRFSIPTWDLSIGLGGDVISTLNYYGLGDPLNLLAVLVPARYTEFLYNFLVILRLYLAGISFFIFCRHHGYEEKRILPGALIYVFSFYSIVVSVLHPFFLNPLIYFPLILLGIDLILEERKPFVYIIFCALAAVTNFYFFYMLSILMVIYAVIRYVYMYGSTWKPAHLLKMIGTCVGCYLIALVLALPLFLPSARGVLGGGRVNGEVYVPVFYELSYYVKLVIAFVNASADYYSAMGYTSVGLIAVLFLLIRTKVKEKLPFKIAFLLGTLFILIPFFGHVLNGFSYVTNRWVWAYCFVVALIVVEMMPKMTEGHWSVKWITAAGTILFAVPTFFMRANGNKEKLIVAALILLGAAFALVLVLLSDRRRKEKTRVYLGIILVNLFLNAFSFYSPYSGNDIAKHEDFGTAYTNRMNGFFEIFDEQGIDTSETRIDTTNMGFAGVKANSAMLYDVNSTSFYYSVSNRYTRQFLSDMELPVSSDNIYVDMDGRTMVDALLGCRYFVIQTGDECYLPYGYDTLIAREESYSVYESDKVLPLIYMYDSYMTKENYDKLSAVQKQQALLQTCVVENSAGILLPEENEETLQFADTESTYRITEVSAGIQVGEHEITVSEEGAFLVLSTEEAENAERYLAFENLEYHGDGIAYIQISDGIAEKSLEIRSKTNSLYSGIHDMMCNMGYREKHGTEYMIRFSKTGTYTFDDIMIKNQSMQYYDAMVTELTEHTLEYEWREDGVEIHTNGTTAGLVYLAIPYSDGWSAWVDGEKVPCLNANNFGIGIYVEPGEHVMELEYHTR